MNKHHPHANPEPAAKPRRRRAYPPASDLRVLRLRHGVRLSDVAAEAGLTLTRASYIERDPSIGTEPEILALRAAILSLTREAEGVAV